MQDFYIKKLTLTGSHVDPASIDFIDGLNIICGPSNTGKSFIAECFDYMFGCKAKDFRIGKETGYDCVNLHITTYNGDITLERKFEINHIEVSSNNPDFESGLYSIGKAKLNINSFWLQLMGIENQPSIIKSENFDRQSLTLRSFLNTFFIEEDNVFQEESIMFQKSVFSRTAILSILLYFISGNSFDHEDPKETKEIKEVRKKAVISYINSNLSYLAIRKAELADFTAPNVEEIQEKIEVILHQINETEGEISKAVLRSKELSNEILKLNEQLAECNMLHNRYHILRSQYQSDIKRLSFLVEGELHINDIPEISNCPFCNGSLSNEEEKSCADAAHAELIKIISQLSDLDDAESDITFEEEELQEKSTVLELERLNTTFIINSELRPRIANLQNTLNDYRRSIEINKEASVISSFEENITEDLRKYEKDEGLSIKYKPKEHFSKEIMTMIDTILSDILKTCNFDNFSNAYFSLDSFDVVVNGKSKKKYGKGYRAFLNTTVALSFMKYLSEHGTYAPTLLIVDSPILSLKEKDVDTSDSMKSSLFKYMVDNQEYGQTIIIENEIPDINYGTAKITRFTHDEKSGRYGLLFGNTN